MRGKKKENPGCFISHEALATVLQMQSAVMGWSGEARESGSRSNARARARVVAKPENWHSPEGPGRDAVEGSYILKSPRDVSTGREAARGPWWVGGNAG